MPHPPGWQLQYGKSASRSWAYRLELKGRTSRISSLRIWSNKEIQSTSKSELRGHKSCREWRELGGFPSYSGVDPKRGAKH